MYRRVGGGLAVAAVLVFAAYLGWPGGVIRPNAVRAPAAMASVSGDVNGDGRLNVLDPFQAAREARDGEASSVDIDGLLAQCVRLDELDVTAPSARREVGG